MRFKEIFEAKEDFTYMSKNIKDFSEKIANDESISEFEDLMNNIEKVIGAKNWSFDKYGNSDEITFTVPQKKQKKFFDITKSFGLEIK